MQSVAVFLCILAALYTGSYGQGATKQCYACATPALKGLWHLTGFSFKLADSDFVRTCDDPKATATNPIRKESCSGPCVSLIFDVPDVSEKYIVRSCHTTLVGYDLQMPDSSYCEKETTTAAGQSGGTVSLQRAVKFCTSDLCNSDKEITETCTSTTPSVRCYACTDDDSNCKTEDEDRGGGQSYASGKWCYRRYYKFGDERRVEKGSTEVNVFGRPHCAHYKGQAWFPMNNWVDMDSQTCACQSNQCNSAARFSLAISSLLLPATILYFLMLVV